MSLEHTLLILGSQNAKKEDQKLSRNQIKPVQLLAPGKDPKPVSFFNDWGKVGVSSIAWDPESFDGTLYVSVNDEIRRLNSRSGNWEVLAMDKVGDIHDINLEGDILWISNTEYDEAIAYNTAENKITERISLHPYREELEEARDDEDYEKIKDRFHCNQVFLNYEGERCVLIHSISGWQFYRVLFEMMVKKQGDGGVINLDTGAIHPLKLQSPHSVRLINNEYWIQDSGDLSVKIFDRDWNAVKEIKAGGFGRGVDFSEEDDRVYIGLSATRKRYLKIIPTSDYLSNRLLITTVKSLKKLDEIPVPNIEQMDNVYILNQKMLNTFRHLASL